jgi:hypothetical protein
VSLGGIFLGPSMNNVVEDSTSIEILRDAISYRVQYLEVFLDSKLILRQLNDSYRV